VTTLADRIPPQHQEAEQAALGAMLTEKRAIAEVRTWLRPAMFYGTAHQKIAEAVFSLFDRGEPVDVMTLNTHLRDQGALDEVGGMPYLMTLTDACPTAANVGKYASAVRDAATKRALIAEAGQIVAAAHDTGRSCEEVLANAQQRVARIASEGLPSRWEPARAVVGRVFDSIEEQMQAGQGRHPGVKSGLAALDTVTGGWQKGELVVIAARPSHGKTALALQFAVEAAKQGVGTGFVTLEQSAESLARRMLAQQGDVPASEVQFSYIADEVEWKRLTDTCGALYSLPLHFWDVGSAGVGEVRARATELHAREPLGLLVVDYLQLLKVPRGGDTLRVGVTENIRGLKALGKDLQVPVIVLSQLTRSAEQAGRRPMLWDLRESGAIEDTADRVLFIYFEEAEQRKQGGPAWLLLEKNRSGECRDFEVHWEPTRMRFAEPALETVGAREW